MSKPNNHGAADDGAEQTDELVNRRKAVARFAAYTAPAMLAVLMSTREGKATTVASVTGPG